MFAKKGICKFVALGMAGSLLVSCSFVKEHTSAETYNTLTFSDGGEEKANQATVAYSNGDFKTAEKYFLEALQENPNQTQALLVGALLSEKIGRLNRARSYYEQLILINGDEMTVLGNEKMLPEKVTDVAKKRLKMIEIQQSTLIVEDADGNKIFNIEGPDGKERPKSAIEQALFKKAQQVSQEQQFSSEEELKNVEILFSPEEQNIISRFLILKELAEKDLITKQEFLQARMANIGGLLPLTYQPGAEGIERSVPSPDVILNRIKVLKDAVESRTITPQEFSAERDIIIEALLPPTPRVRMKRKAPSRDIMGAAKDLRKLEMLYELNLITTKEKAKEKAAIEKYLGINRAPAVKKAPAKKVVAASKSQAACTLDDKNLTDKKSEVKKQPEKEILKTELNPVVKNGSIVVEPQIKLEDNKAPQPLIPSVSNPFQK